MKRFVTSIWLLAIWTVAVCSPVQANHNTLFVPTSVEQKEITPEMMGPFTPEQLTAKNLQKVFNQVRDNVDRRGWGTREYFDNNNVLFKASKVYRDMTLAINTAPQVPGGLKKNGYQLSKYEQWTTLTEDTLMATMTWGGNLYIGWVKAGEEVLQNTKDHPTAPLLVKAIERCGNWVRIIGATFTVFCPPTAGPCVPTSNSMLRVGEQQKITSPDGLTETIIDTFSDGCKTTVNTTITKTVKLPGLPVEKPCVPGGNNRLDEFHVNKAINPFEFIDKSLKLTEEQKTAVKGLILLPDKVKKITDLIIYWNGCGFSIFAFSVEPGGLGWWKWLIPAIAVGAFLAGYYFSRGGSKITPIKETPTSGSPTPIRIKIPF